MGKNGLVGAGISISTVFRFDLSDPATLALGRPVARPGVDHRLADPVWTDHQGWRYALPEGRIRSGPLEAAEREGLYCLGDWVAGSGRLHAVLRNGLKKRERIAHSL